LECSTSLSFLATLAVVLGLISWGSALNAQTTPSTPTDTQTQPAPTPDTPPTQQTPQPTPSPDVPPATQQTPSSQSPSTQNPPAQTPDQTQTPDSKSDAPPTAATPSATDTQTFSGTVVKSGDKYMLKTDSGKTYDIDHQDDVMKFDGKRVKVQGKLDDTGTKILVK
jgi:outer membrane biosynthesis protein TonB